MQNFSKQESLFFAILALAIIIVSLALASVFLLSKQPEPYTELYFDLPSLSETAVYGENLEFTFFVENHEAQNMDYKYTVLVAGDAVKEKTISIAQGAKDQVTETVLVYAGEQKIEVVLENSFQDQYNIFFWVKGESA
tara:strand:- start:104 stop:517 length:414 start_codon:yes stop_codon:yes gene_type:complete